MPVDIFGIPPEKKITKKTLSLWIEVGVLFCMAAVYISVFLIYFPQHLSKNGYVFWSQLLLVPILLGWAFLFFRMILRNGENIEVINWNTARSAYYKELLQKGRSGLDIIELQIRLPDLNGNVVNVVGGSLLPFRYTPKYTHMARYLTFNSSINEVKESGEVRKGKVLLFEGIMGDLVCNMLRHISLLPKNARLKVVCVLDDDLKPLMDNVFQIHFKSIVPMANIEFSKNLYESFDNWLDNASAEYIILIAASFYGAELLDENINNKSESIIFLLGKLNVNSKIAKHSPFGTLFRPEFDWVGINKSLIWGGANDGEKLSGVVYSGLNEEEIKNLVLKTADFMSETALSSYNYVDSDNYIGMCPPLTEFLQLSYVNENLTPGKYLFISKNNNLLTSHFFCFVAGSKGTL